MISHSMPWIIEDDIKSVQKSITEKQLSQGRYADFFSTMLKEYTESNYCQLVDSGSRAIQLALSILGIKNLDEVILPSYVCPSVLDAVLSLNATPVICDTGEYWNMTADTVKSCISPKTKAIIVVHIFGIVVDNSLFKDFNIPIINDFCQCLIKPSRFNLNKADNSISIYSFQATKCISTGEGGAIAFDFAPYYEKLTEFSKLSFGSFTDIQAVLGISQLNRYEKALELRNAIAIKYIQGIKSFLTEKFVSVLDFSICYRFLISKDSLDFESIKNKFAKKGIHIRHGVDTLLHRQLYLRDEDFVNSVKSFNNTMSLPIYPGLNNDDMNYIIQNVNEILS
jgi:perosamine synthetase